MKRIFCFVMIAALFLCGTVPAFAEESIGGDWYVHFTPNAKMDSNFTAVRSNGSSGKTMSEAMSELQPGDKATFYMELKNEHVEDTDWYMTNEVLQTLEDAVDVAEGGAYGYVLTYVHPNGQREELYSSYNVGGEDKTVADREGLREATSSLEEWFYLDTLKKNDVGQIILEVELEGETQGNKYQDTMAQLQMNFAVELTQTQTRRREFSSVRTGDEEQMLVWSGVSLACGLTALLLAVVRKRREDEEGENA